MEKIKRFIECLIPVTICNLKCTYCYVMQRNNRKNKMADLKYTPKEIGEAMSMERWGGTCYFSICGAGETTLQVGIEDIVYEIMKNGHYVNITTNGTLEKRMQMILDTNSEHLDHLHFSFSFHYLELKRHNLIETFFKNIEMVKQAGASFLVQINLCDEYVPFLDEIKKLCVSKTGAMPQVVVTRKEEDGLQKIELMTNYTIEEYKTLGNAFKSPLFDFTLKNFNVKRNEFCYAGDWTAILDLSTGVMRRCYSSYIYQDVFRNPSEKIGFLAIGNFCSSPFCMNSSHFMSLGVIPEIETPTYAQLRNRVDVNWYTDNMKKFLSTKLCESNDCYGIPKRMLSELVGVVDGLIRRTYRIVKIIKKRKRNEYQKTSSNGS